MNHEEYNYLICRRGDDCIPIERAPSLDDALKSAYQDLGIGYGDKIAVIISRYFDRDDIEAYAKALIDRNDDGEYKYDVCDVWSSTPPSWVETWEELWLEQNA